MPKVVVVGGGPAGSTCAARLASRGIDVTLLERSAFPRIKVCGEYLNAAAQAELVGLGVGDAVLSECNAIVGIQLNVNGTPLELPFPAAAWAIPRARLDDVLLSRARCAGAETITARVEDVKVAADCVRVFFRDASGSQHTLRADLVVGADGLGSLVARKCALASRNKRQGRFAIGGHYTGFGSLDGFIEMYVTSNAYFAINPLNSGLANVMIVVGQSKLQQWSGEFDRRMEQTAVQLAAGKRGISAVQRVGKRVAIGPLSHDVRSVATKNVYLVGDASGFIDPFTGQGVYLALHSARLAAAAIEAQLADKEDAERVHARYRSQHQDIFGARARVAALVAFLVRTPWLAKRAARNLKRNSELRNSVMSIIAGQEGPGQALSSATILRLVA